MIEEAIAAAVAAEVRKVVREEVRAALAETGQKAPAVPELLTVDEVSARSHHKPKTVRAWISSGALPARLVSRRYLVEPKDLEKFLAARAPKAAPDVKGEVARLLHAVRR